MIVPSNFDPVEQEEIKALCLKAIEAVFPEMVQAMKQLLETAQNLLPEKDPVKADLQLRTLGILPRDQPALLLKDQRPIMTVFHLSEELNVSPDQAQEALDALIVLGYVQVRMKAKGCPGYRLSF